MEIININAIVETESALTATVTYKTRSLFGSTVHRREIHIMRYGRIYYNPTWVDSTRSASHRIMDLVISAKEAPNRFLTFGFNNN